MNKCIAAVDAGTGGVRCVIYNADGNILSQSYHEIKTLYTSDGRAEHDPNAFADAALDAVADAVSNCPLKSDAIAGVSFAGTQTTFVPVDRNGHYLTNILLWQDMRGMEMFPMIRETLAKNGMTEEDLYLRTFRPLDTLLAGAKLLWLRLHEPDIYGKIHKLVNPQCLLLRAFGAEGFTVDCTDTGWWLSHDSVTMKTDPMLTDMFGIDPDFFPELTEPCETAGYVSPYAAERTGLKVGTPLFQGAVDQCCAALGAGNFGDPGLGTLCLGTAGVISSYSDEPVPDPMRRYYVIHYPTGGYLSELAVPVAASAFRWVRDMLYPADTYSCENIYRRMDAEAETAAIGAGGLVFLPHMSGTVYPRSDTSVRGGFVGASLGTTRADLIRAAMEGICFGMRHIMESGGYNFKTLRLLGGASRSELWNRMQADIYGCPVETIASDEASALGTAMIAAAGSGIYPSLKDAVIGMSRICSRYEPNAANTERYSEVYEAWQYCMDGLTKYAFTTLEKLRFKNDK